MFFQWLKHYMPRSLYARAALILVLPVVVVLLVVSVAFIQNHLQGIIAQMTRSVSRQVEFVVDEVDQAADRDAALRRMEPMLPALQMRLRFVEPEQVPPDFIRWFDFSGMHVRRLMRNSVPQMLAVRFNADSSVQLFVDTVHGPLEIGFHRSLVTVSTPHQLLVTMVAFALLMTVISFVYMRNQLRPITRLADAAEAFGRGRPEPYRPAGAVEVRAAGNAFLDMRARIERQIEQRTLMLSGVSHDLRTPLTRLKLGLSMLEDEDEAAPLLRDVDEMQRLVETFLEFSRGAAASEPEPTDPIALVRAIVEDAVRAGKQVSLGDLVGEGEVVLRAVAIRRAVENLIDNAVRYGNRAVVSVLLTERSLRIRVEDDGPGIPADLRAEAMKPFARLDPARNQDKGSGVGLGLAIVTDVARAHGGTLRLGKSGRLGGLCADIVIGR